MGRTSVSRVWFAPFSEPMGGWTLSHGNTQNKKAKHTEVFCMRTVFYPLVITLYLFAQWSRLWVALSREVWFRKGSLLHNRTHGSGFEKDHSCTTEHMSPAQQNTWLGVVSKRITPAQNTPKTHVCVCVFQNKTYIFAHLGSLE
jgi:hypothetical protein